MGSPCHRIVYGNYLFLPQSIIIIRLLNRSNILLNSSSSTMSIFIYLWILIWCRWRSLRWKWLCLRLIIITKINISPSDSVFRQESNIYKYFLCRQINRCLFGVGSFDILNGITFGSVTFCRWLRSLSLFQWRFYDILSFFIDAQLHPIKHHATRVVYTLTHHIHIIPLNNNYDYPKITYWR